jgi:hypothetical protein
VCVGRAPVEITSGVLFRVEVEDSVLHVRRMEYAPGRGYYAVGGQRLRVHGPWQQ